MRPRNDEDAALKVLWADNMQTNRLDVSQHMSLCRHYVRELRRSVLIGTPELEKGGGSKRSSQALDNFERVSSEQGPSAHRHRSSEGGLSAFLRNDNGSKHSPKNSQHSNRSDLTSEAPPRPSYMAGDSPMTPSPQINSNSSPNHTVARADIRASAEKILVTQKGRIFNRVFRTQKIWSLRRRTFCWILLCAILLVVAIVLGVVLGLTLKAHADAHADAK